MLKTWNRNKYFQLTGRRKLEINIIKKLIRIFENEFLILENYI